MEYVYENNVKAFGHSMLALYGIEQLGDYVIFHFGQNPKRRCKIITRKGEI